MSRLPKLPPTPASHFKLHVYAAVLELRARLPQLVSVEFLADYFAELDQAGFRADAEPARWWDGIVAWERSIDRHLPLRSLRVSADLDQDAMTLLFILGLPEEDARFGVLFEALAVAGSNRRPNVGLVTAWNPSFRRAVRRLLRLGLVETVNPDAARSEWALQVSAPIWDVLRGDAESDVTPWARYVPPAALVALDELVLPSELARRVEALRELVAGPGASPVIVRGPGGSGRRAVLGALARSLERGVLQVADVEAAGPMVGPLATLLDAVPVLAFEPAPAETIELPAVAAYAGPVGIALGRRGGIVGPGAEGAVVLELPMPDAEARAQHWTKALGTRSPDGLAAGLRTTPGAIARLAPIARSQAALNGRAEVGRADVADAERILHAQALDALAVRVDVGGDWFDLAVSDETMRELRLLESRCRHRERLGDSAGSVGVRALFSGPSGTGKTLAARLLAAALGKDLFAIELSIVDKYLGETEKKLETLFSRAEELDLVLLLDEGDALLTRRTEVRTSNDRYANLETNFLLQRLESFEGILVVTTNAGERIDSAFRRRIDVVIDFKPPSPAERWTIWRLHLPADHAVDEHFLEDVVSRCALTGGQIRNAVLHAQLLALDEDLPLDDAHVDEAVRREYRKAGAVCPLRDRMHA
jgi:hypothetical protein